MALTGACSNPEPRDKLVEANRVRAKLLAQPAGAASIVRVPPRQIRATTAIMEVLRDSDMPLGIVDVLGRVDLLLGRSVRRGSVKAALAEMAASPTNPVRRVGRGRYELHLV